MATGISFRVADRDAYTGVQAYWLDLDLGKRKSHCQRAQKASENKPRNSKGGDYIAGEDGNVLYCGQPSTMDRRATGCRCKMATAQAWRSRFNMTLARGRAESVPGNAWNRGGI